MTMREKRKSAVRKILGSWMLEGFQPDQEFLTLLDRYVEGKMSLQEINIMVDAQFNIAHGGKQ